MPRPALDDPALRAWRDQTLYRLLLRGSRSETTATLERLHAAGHTGVSLTDTNLMANLDMDGTILSALARRAGVTRQAIGQQVGALERAGYVERRSSEVDGRAIVVQRTDEGRRLLDDALDIVEDLEQSYTDVLGARDLERLKGLLARLLETIDPEGALGPA